MKSDVYNLYKSILKADKEECMAVINSIDDLEMAKELIRLLASKINLDSNHMKLLVNGYGKYERM